MRPLQVWGTGLGRSPSQGESAHEVLLWHAGQSGLEAVPCGQLQLTVAAGPLAVGKLGGRSVGLKPFQRQHTCSVHRAAGCCVMASSDQIRQNTSTTNGLVLIIAVFKCSMCVCTARADMSRLDMLRLQVARVQCGHSVLTAGCHWRSSCLGCVEGAGAHI